MRILIAGATGYVGSALIRELRERHEIWGLARDSHAIAKLTGNGVTPVPGNVTSLESIAEAVGNCDAVIVSWYVADTNDVHGALDLILESLAGTGKTLIFTSGTGVLSDRAMGEPSDTVYAENTAFTPDSIEAPRVELELKVLHAASRGIRSMVVRPPMIYGNAGSFQVPLLIRTARERGVSPYIGRGLNRWSHVHINDLARLYSLALVRGASAQVYHAVSGDATLRDIAASIASITSTSPMSWTPAQAAAAWGEYIAQVAIGCNSRTSSLQTQDALHWKPHEIGLLEDLSAGSYRHR